MGHWVALRRICEMRLGGLECISHEFGYEGHCGHHLDVFGSVGGLWDPPALRLGSRDVAGGVVAGRDAFEGGGRVLGTSWAPETCSGLGVGSGMHQPCVWDQEVSLVVLWLAETCFGVGAGSGIRQPRIWDCGTSWVSLLVTETC
jgi:hypothetical protein